VSSSTSCSHIGRVIKSWTAFNFQARSLEEHQNSSKNSQNAEMSHCKKIFRILLVVNCFTGVNFTNILHAHFLYKSAWRSFSLSSYVLAMAKGFFAKKHFFTKKCVHKIVIYCITGGPR